MQRPIAIVLVLLAGGAAFAALRFGESALPRHYTGFVEGEERILRAEVAGRIVAIEAEEGAPVAAGAVVARFDDGDIQARLATKRQALVVVDAQIRAEEERIALLETTWQRDVAARAAGLRRARATAGLAERTYDRLQRLAGTGVSTAQEVDDARARSDEARSAVDEAAALLASAEAQERNIAMARQQLDALREQRTLGEKELAELHVLQAKYVLRAPDVATIVQTQFAWPGELAQPGTPILGVLDPLEKHVLVYVPVPDLSEFRLGRRVSLELDSQPGRRFAGEVSFVASEASFTPQKIETRSDRIGQVYRAKVRLLEAAAELRPGTEGNLVLEPDA